MAFIIAGLVVLITLALAFLQLFAAGMKSGGAPEPSGAGWTLIVGLGLAALIAGSHWLPRIGW